MPAEQTQRNWTILQRHLQGRTVGQLATEYKLSHSRVSRIISHARTVAEAIDTGMLFCNHKKYGDRTGLRCCLAPGHRGGHLYRKRE